MKEVIKMTAQEAVRRNEKSQWLKVWQVDDTWFYVESEDGKIAYKCCVSEQGDYCNCGDFATRFKHDSNFKCKHLLAVMNSIPKNEVLEAQFMDKRKPRLDERFIKQVDGKDFVLYSGLLDLAHQKNLISSMDVELIQYPTKENDHTAVCKAIAKTALGGPFIDVGDANPMNCNSKVAKHLIRMASTRAKARARALRDLTNIGMTALEELGDLSEVIGENDHVKAQMRKNNVKPFQAKQAQTAQPGNGDGRKSVNENPIPNQDKVQMAVQPDTPVLSPAEAPANQSEIEQAGTKPGKASNC
jgi:predicted nucleic acid-binding Zn finger protein